MRVHELAKELGLSSKDLLAKLHDLGIEIKTASSRVDETAIELLREQGADTAETPAPAPVTEAPAAEDTDAAEAPAEAPEPAAPEAEPEPEAEPKPEPEKPVIVLCGAIIVKDLADELGIRPNLLVAELMKMNVFAAINQRIDVSVAHEVARRHGFVLEHEKKITEHRTVQKKGLTETPEGDDRPEDMLPRAPVVTFLGHVDHGKTSLLDRIRNTTVAKGEDGGITQHIGAYTVDLGGNRITFLDTPGHAAFTAMRARGANLTDIAVLVVAADDAVMPQTREAIQHAKAAGVAILVAINKIDLPNAGVDRVKQQLQAEGLAPEDWGGETVCVPVSAETGEGVQHLLEMIALQADMLELQANPRRRAQGFVIEARMEPGRGPTANLLVKRGTLKIGDAIRSGPHCGRVRALINDHGAMLKTAGPSMPVQCLGLAGIPEAGAEFQVYANEKVARSHAEAEALKSRADRELVPKKASLESIFDHLENEEKVELKAILKADTQGSVEAIVHALNEINSDKVSLSFALSGTGNITVNDVMLASASNAIVMGFHVPKEPGVDTAARREGVQIRQHSVIYELIDEIRDAMLGLLAPAVREDILGNAQVRQVFPLGKIGTVAGCMVIKGTMNAKARVRVRRGDEVLFEGGMASLRHFQDDVAEVREAQECGIRMEGYNDVAEGDIIQCYQLTEVAQSL